MKKTVIFLTLFFLMISSGAVLFAEDQTAGDLTTPEVVGDLLWVRPLGAVQVGLGAIAYVVSLPVTLPLKKEEGAREFLITYPFYYYFKRPLREM